jgi:hypothetical protein
MFFWHQGYFASRILTSGANSESLVLSRKVLTSGETVNRWYYLEVLVRLRKNVRRKRPQLWRNNSWFLHHDNAPAHASLLIVTFWPTRTQLRFHSHPTHLTRLWQTFCYFPKWNPLWKDDDWRDYGKFTDGATRDPEVGVPGLFPEVATAFGTMHQCRRGVIPRR